MPLMESLSDPQDLQRCIRDLVALSIIAAHGGELRSEPNLAGGTIFRFTLPALAGERDDR